MTLKTLAEQHVDAVSRKTLLHIIDANTVGYEDISGASIGAIRDAALLRLNEPKKLGKYLEGLIQDGLVSTDYAENHLGIELYTLTQQGRNALGERGFPSLIRPSE